RCQINSMWDCSSRPCQDAARIRICACCTYHVQHAQYACCAYTDLISFITIRKKSNISVVCPYGSLGLYVDPTSSFVVYLLIAVQILCMMRILYSSTNP